jgi:hypothetical protein
LPFFQSTVNSSKPNIWGVTPLVYRRAQRSRQAA